ncbi:sigma-70 family RNA polymerase sigma factor [Kribbella pittospori]|uniref:Sigma-70 family RNA polymerase sigma factor n=1 Tax=Kribbella pittospori TaxID=722689 RepID=A0A4R0KRK8_9ACTN|nr:sigma-70 family RNA polymerase sigma factor [Kribbella pittospori]TCC62054.1 sigma-70 family RNA polymerase sigma factor [Kribbella pittospori]
MTGEAEFARRTEPFRKELLAHCYRLMASVDEAEDLVQETYLRAWRSFATFEGRSSLRVWLYRIATNACLTALEQRGRRALPSGLGAPSDDLSGAVPPPLAEVAWVEPIPDALVISSSADPATIVTTRESLRLALIAALQHLPPKQRAVLILREVLAFPAAEVAMMLDTSVAAVKSTLQRARARLDETAPAPGEVIEPSDPQAQALLAEYIAGFENADTAALERALRTDAAIEMVGSAAWFNGRVVCLRVLEASVGKPGDWHMQPTLANGQPAVVAYVRSSAGGPHEALGVALLTPTASGLTHIHVFSNPELALRFGWPLMYPER